MTGNKFYHDANKCPRAEYAPPNEMLGWYLEQDVQSSPATCDELQSICTDVTSGAMERWEGVGNAHSILVEGENVTIRNEFDNDAEPCTVPIEEFQSALTQWKKLIGV